MRVAAQSAFKMDDFGNLTIKLDGYEITFHNGNGLDQFMTPEAREALPPDSMTGRLPTLEEQMTRHREELRRRVLQQVEAERERQRRAAQEGQ